MWEVIGIIAAVVVIMLFLQLMDFTEVLKNRLRGGSNTSGVEAQIDAKFAHLEKRLADIEEKLS